MNSSFWLWLLYRSDHYGLKVHTNKTSGDVDAAKWTDSEDSEEELNELDLSAGNKDTCIIEVNVNLQ